MIAKLIKSALGKGGTTNDYVGIDIGTSTTKVVEIELGGEKPILKNAGLQPTPASAVKNNVVSKPEDIALVIRSIIEANGITATRATFAIPSPAVFTKRINVSAQNLKQLQDAMTFEAQNYIPHNLDAVRLDYQVVQTKSNGTMDVLLVAVKTDIISGYTQAIELAGLEPVIADVDAFALANMFIISYPECNNQTISLVDIGAKFTSVTLISNGDVLISGDASVGSRLYTDALCETLSLSAAEADQAKIGQIKEGVDAGQVQEIIERTTEHISSEIQRQIGFLWSASGTDNTIDAVYYSGGGAMTKGLGQALAKKVNVKCEIIDAMRAVQIPDQFDPEFLKEISSAVAISLGLALRRKGDKKHSLEAAD